MAVADERKLVRIMSVNALDGFRVKLGFTGAGLLATGSRSIAVWNEHSSGSDAHPTLPLAGGGICGEICC
jgi:hypothetical protein